MSEHGGRTRVAIIGAGVSGLVAAYRLHRSHDVTVFEAGSYAGGHTNTIDVQTEGGTLPVDTGFIVFNERNYPLFSALLDELGVASQPTCMSFSVRCDRTGLEYNGTSLSKLFAQRRNLLRPSFWRMLADIVRFGRQAQGVLEGSDDVSVGDYLLQQRFSRGFVERYFLPLGASLWSCSPQTFESFPMRFVVEFLENHFMLQVGGRPVWRVVQGGSRRYVEALTRDFSDRIRLSTPVRSVERSAEGVRIWPVGGEPEDFDEVIFACHADQALRMLATPTRNEREILSAFPYQPNEAVLHTDISVLPRRRRAWAAWNYRVTKGQARSASVTYDMNILQTLSSSTEFLVTLNPEVGEIDPARVIRRIQYHHPTFDRRRSDAQARHRELIRNLRTSFCGAYWGYGFHEDGVRSAVAVCEAFVGESQNAQLSL